ncbi:MAG TPA: FliA/WhiG family RNA polymerase sigma factor [Deltaproteobacteria bacterium]|jgi:RNA polymerase sigma factor for flagellar operon FliA|nr:FliA/WhiG family RNA polymerase sigma factor [Deltaproteobacteria bacterium]OQC23049.1 MAG: RNA polymerase sigma factor FliA [Deltaproteobacteria bacterium ADurb.Bin072]HRW79644.1 FliA/WhiG family RNA polymerase sigma factor [Desulfomonilia bacterium]NMD39359.1 FliA/WhiG family RNA polymerase sigma factor [Deltaproteobacteria bacterium]HNQ85909.1 FliA/WhiG family RNA polymerase sigma factor [Deltaproteobacteria bacterium]
MQDIVYTELTEEQKLNPKVRGKIINEFAPLIKYIASRIAIRLPPHIDLNDLINAGVIGLIDAIEKFDASKQIKFKTYAEFRIRGAILDELRSMDWVPRSVRQKARKVEDTIARLEFTLGRPARDEEVANEMNIDMDSFYRLLSETASVSLLSLDDLGEDDTDLSRRNLLEYIIQDERDWPSHKIRYAEVSTMVAKAIQSLPEKERMVISLYYYDELTMKEIGHVLKFTESRVSQIHTKAVLRLRSKMNKILKEISM